MTLGQAPGRSSRRWPLLVLAGLGPSLAAPDAGASPLSLYQQRAAYRETLAALDAGRMEEFQRGRAALQDYPLAPYLDYYQLSRRLSAVSASEMQAFQARHGDLPVAAIVHYRWLKVLGARGQWTVLLDNYRPTSDAELNCYHRRGLLAGGRRAEALDGIAALWTVGYSQPEACDPLFDAWIDAGGVSGDLAWQRLQLALDAGQTRLGRYLLRYLDGPHAPWGEALYQVHVDPARITRNGSYRDDGPDARIVIAHGLKRLAARDPAAALAAWQRYEDSHRFSAEAILGINQYLLLAAARDGSFPSRRLPAYTAEFVEAMAELAVRDQRFTELLYWIEQMTAEQRDDARWRYWQARALARTGLGTQQARGDFENLAAERNYYGFLAAARVGLTPRMNAASAPVLAAELAAVRNLPPMRRALELYAVGDQLNARREWYAALPALTPSQQFHAARVAQQEGWLAQGIMTANEADMHDYIELRFPVGYQDLFRRTSEATTVPAPFLFAVARQESAFEPSARSHADARGLMQLIPPTASRVASRIGVARPAPTDLYDPNVNITLGGHHLADLMNRYGNRRPLVAAAYNAGEHRVDRWIRDRDGLDMDVWIEDIPFRETRNYVKNVLAFTQVYAYLIGEPVPVLDTHEASIN